LRDWTPISSSNLTSHVISAAACDMALYSASEDDLEMVLCFLLFQLIGDLPKRITYPVVDLLENGHAASLNQSMLVKNVGLQLGEECLCLLWN